LVAWWASINFREMNKAEKQVGKAHFPAIIGKIFFIEDLSNSLLHTAFEIIIIHQDHFETLLMCLIKLVAFAFNKELAILTR
jgi:hypothetical protein